MPDDLGNVAPRADAGPWSPETFDDEWIDSSRQRRIPLRVYYPAGAGQSLPVLLFSHGLGGSRVGYGYLGRHWASWGYVSIHLTHLGTDTSVWQHAASPTAAMRAAALDFTNVLQRPYDMRFALDRLPELQRGASPVAGRLDLDRVGVGGHSMGAQTALALAGMIVLGPEHRQYRFADPRFRAGLILSPPVRRKHHAPESTHGVTDRFDHVYGPVAIPCLHLTGTHDESPIGLTHTADRRVPYGHIPRRDQYLVTLDGGDHMMFADRRRSERPHESLLRQWIRAATTHFLDAYLAADARTQRWLQSGGLQGLIGAHGKAERKV